MTKNQILYQSACALVIAAGYIKHLDNEYAQELLDKAEEFKNQITVDPELEKEIESYEQKIRKGL